MHIDFVEFENWLRFFESKLCFGIYTFHISQIATEKHFGKKKLRNFFLRFRVGRSLVFQVRAYKEADFCYS